MWNERVIQDPTRKAKIRRGPRGRIRMYAEALIKQDKLTDKEMCEQIKLKFPGASTSVKCIQYYRCIMREEGKIPPAKNSKRKERIVLKWELIPIREDFAYLNIEGTWNAKELIDITRTVMTATERLTKREAMYEIYSVPTCAFHLGQLGWECCEIETIQKYGESIDGYNNCSNNTIHNM